MADTYGVTPADVAAELPGIFPGGFATSTVPTIGQVTSFISVADLQTTVAVQNASGTLPTASDRLAPLAKQVIINRVVARVLRIVYAGNDPVNVNAAAKPYDDSATLALTAITDLETQATGIGEPPNRMMTSGTIPDRDLLVCDDDLGPAPHGRLGRLGGRHTGQY